LGIIFNNFVPSLCGLGFGAWLLRETYLLDVQVAHQAGGGMNAAGYPRLLALLIIGLSAILLWKSFIWRSDRREDAEAEPAHGDRWPSRKVLMAFFGCIVYTVLLSSVGYLIMTPLLLAFVMILVGDRRWLFIVSTAIILTFTLYAVTFYVFHIVLPEGIMQYVSDFI
jgi:hypothetical protein